MLRIGVAVAAGIERVVGIAPVGRKGRDRVLDHVGRAAVLADAPTGIDHLQRMDQGAEALTLEPAGARDREMRARRKCEDDDGARQMRGIAPLRDVGDDVMAAMVLARRRLEIDGDRRIARLDPRQHHGAGSIAERQDDPARVHAILRRNSGEVCSASFGSKTEA